AAADRASLLALVRAGKAADAWKAWAALPDGAAKHRLGVEIAVEAKDIARALDEYDSLTVNGKTPDQALLKLTALGEATILAADRDPDVRLEACAAAVVLDAAHAACRPLLEDMAAHGADPDHQGLGAYALANAGQRPFPGLFGTLELTMTRATRLRLAQSMTRLPAAERLALAREFIEDREPAVQYQTMLVLADVPGEDVAAALRSAQVSGPATLARTVALGRHGDAPSLASLDEMLPNLTGYVK